ncbi:hypothetical protein SCP_0313550 [Sparassis crispa]|uniref:Uncharacterized protein n=1 Tax=Sparassis crispa TaxID=139825 RepID=A0A401GHF3_9APHY|nr:hypothetical protein SCP_0313550 [Sparassis crispa]GBE81626.1 hypothetical protein SCP_0313550 [Sparassis crispa]
MGRSAKVHKRTKKTVSSTSAAASAPIPPHKVKQTALGAAPQEQKKRAGLKAKAKGASKRRGDEGPILGGADYVELMLGGRRRAMDEAGKLSGKE